jgi:hypothetical protein
MLRTVKRYMVLHTLKSHANLPASHVVHLQAVFTKCMRDTFDPTPNGAKLQQLCVPSGMLSPSRFSNMTFYSSPTASSTTAVTVAEILVRTRSSMGHPISTGTDQCNTGIHMYIACCALLLQ